MGVPVLLINTQPDQYRFSGLNLLRNTSREHFLRGFDFDIETPTPNSDDYLRYKMLLMSKVKTFVDEPNVRVQPTDARSRAEISEASLWIQLAEKTEAMTALQRRIAELDPLQGKVAEVSGELHAVKHAYGTTQSSTCAAERTA